MPLLLFFYPVNRGVHGGQYQKRQRCRNHKAAGDSCRHRSPEGTRHKRQHTEDCSGSRQHYRAETLNRGIHHCIPGRLSILKMLFYLVDKHNGISDNHAHESKYSEIRHKAQCLVKEQHSEGDADNAHRRGKKREYHKLYTAKLYHEKCHYDEYRDIFWLFMAEDIAVGGIPRDASFAFSIST